jgi:hypothetical protein
MRECAIRKTLFRQPHGQGQTLDGALSPRIQIGRRFMNPVLSLGDTVEWRSQAAGVTRTKRGQIVEVVPPSCRLTSRLKNPGIPRDHTSYVVRASVLDGSDNQKRRRALYWPRVNQLILVETQSETTRRSD